MNSGRFAISVHILTLLTFSEEEWTPSEYLAGSININPVLVRKELSNLRERGLVLSKEGKSGGSRLAKPAGQIFMSEVYCPVGRKINDHLDSLYDDAEKTLLASLGKMSLAEFCSKFD
jgi:DNA-binding IscR family transcriptional regulator